MAYAKPYGVDSEKFVMVMVVMVNDGDIDDGIRRVAWRRSACVA